MPHEPIPPYPKNAPGPFYVENECCITCEAPCHEAPDLIAHDEEGIYPHCYFERQPETPEEVDRAIRACWVSCVECLRYAGDDPEILKRFCEIGHAHLCDVLVGRKPPDSGRKPDESGPESSVLTEPPPTGGRHPLWDRDLDD